MYKILKKPVMQALYGFLALHNAFNFSTFDVSKNKGKLYPNLQITEEDFKKENIRALIFKVIDYYITLEQKTPIVIGDNFFIEYSCETFKLNILLNLPQGEVTIDFKHHGDGIYLGNPTLTGLLTKYFLENDLPEDQKLIVSSYLKYKFDENKKGEDYSQLYIDFFKLESVYTVKMQNPLELDCQILTKRKEVTSKKWDEQDFIEYFVLKIDKEFFAIKFAQKNSYNIGVMERMFP